jgi:hypothetical protein
LVIYEGAGHVLRAALSVTLGESPEHAAADWLADRLANKPASSERVYVTATGLIKSMT